MGYIKLALTVLAAGLGVFEEEIIAHTVPASVETWGWLPPILLVMIAAANAGLDRAPGVVHALRGRLAPGPTPPQPPRG